MEARTRYRAVSLDLWFTALSFDAEIERGWRADRVRALETMLRTEGDRPVSPDRIEAAMDSVQSRLRAEGRDTVVVPPGELVVEYARNLGARLLFPVEEAGRRYSSAGLFEHPPPINPELSSVARALEARGIPLIMITNTARGEASWKDYFRDRGGLRLEHIVASCELGYAKPDPRIFLEASRRLNLPPSEILHVGDRWELDVEGALRSGCGAVLYRGLWPLYPPDFYPEVELTESETPGVLRIDRLDELLDRDLFDPTGHPPQAQA